MKFSISHLSSLIVPILISFKDFRRVSAAPRSDGTDNLSTRSKHSICKKVRRRRKHRNYKFSTLGQFRVKKFVK